jgi:hypothetical protein
MIPFDLIPKLDIFQFAIFQIIQTTLHFIFFIGLYYFGYYILNNRTKLKLKKVLKVAVIIEIMQIITVFSTMFLVVLSAILYVIGPVLILLVDLIVIYLTYEIKKNEKTYLFLIKIIILFLIASISSFILSIFLTDALFYLFGIPDAFILNF